MKFVDRGGMIMFNKVQQYSPFAEEFVNRLCNDDDVQKSGSSFDVDTCFVFRDDRQFMQKSGSLMFYNFLNNNKREP